jgi:hypothetical protein
MAANMNTSGLYARPDSSYFAKENQRIMKRHVKDRLGVAFCYSFLVAFCMDGEVFLGFRLILPQKSRYQVWFSRLQSDC